MNRDEAEAIMVGEFGRLWDYNEGGTTFLAICEAALAALNAAGAIEHCQEKRTADCRHGAEHRAYRLLRAALEVTK